MAFTPLPPLVLRAQSLSVNNLNEDYVFPELGEVTGLAVTNGSSASILLPQELLSSRGMGGNVGVASILFRNLQSFLPNDTEVTHPRSLVISSQVSQRGGNGEAVEALLDNPVTITFSFEAREGEEISFDEIRCVFWDFGGNSATKTGSESVRWSSEGLRTESVTRDGDTVTVTCSSNHLTSFAVLVDVGGARIESEALRIVSYIGLAISLACLLLTIIFFISFGKKLFAAVHNFVHLNLAIALFCGYLVFAVGVELANHEKIPCNVVTALVQYFLLSAFCWMMCEGIMLYLMLVVVFSTLSKKWWFFFLLGWGIPLIFVVIGLGAVHEEYGVKDSSSDSDDYYKYCWLSSGKGTYAIWTFVAPMLAIIIINTVFLILVLGSIVRSRANRQKEVESGYKVDVVVTVVKASVILLPLLGLTWVFGLFAVNENTVVFAWLFTIFNSLQGLFIFIFHVIRNDRVWGLVKKRYAAYSTSRASKSTGSTGIKSNKYHSVASSSTGGLEMKSYVDADASEIKTDLGGGKEPTKEEVA
ncbi:Adhesion G protein-coupled receptor L3 [Geodia barretti]|uniref:Adhesion G protein-coupled receptor L3 n=1 Tax=Geodia barretti TaxID=519541 RepID=A0AA35U054_GEOBA|nr:Adhesion G protein-coupled receptor L3 [Geodia barretti]